MNEPTGLGITVQACLLYFATPLSPLSPDSVTQTVFVVALVTRHTPHIHTLTQSLSDNSLGTTAVGKDK